MKYFLVLIPFLLSTNLSLAEAVLPLAEAPVYAPVAASVPAVEMIPYNSLLESLLNPTFNAAEIIMRTDTEPDPATDGRGWCDFKIKACLATNDARIKSCFFDDDSKVTIVQKIVNEAKVAGCFCDFRETPTAIIYNCRGGVGQDCSGYAELANAAQLGVLACVRAANQAKLNCISDIRSSSPLCKAVYDANGVATN